MTDETTFTLTLDPALRDRFVAEADATLRHAEAAAEIARAVLEADDPGTRRVMHREVRTRLKQQRNAMRSR